DDKTPVHVATEKGYTDIVEQLIDKFGGSITARTRDGSTLLHIAACSGHTSTALAFLKRGVPLFMPNKKGALGLHSAAAAGFNDVVKMLIARGTNVDIRTKDNYTALHVAVQSGKASVVETLLGAGADIHVKGGELGQTALHIDEDANLKLVSKAGETPLHVAAQSCNFEAAQRIITHMAGTCTPDEIRDYINQRTNNGWSPLLEACARGHTGVAQLLLQHHARIDVFDENGRTALHLAALNGHLAIVHILLQHKAFVNR
ncbi:unnamed protein product, partial [Strongylus vulgaris]